MNKQTSVSKVEVLMTNTCTGHENVITVPDDRRIVAMALEFFARSERVPVTKIDITVTPLNKKSVTD